MSTMVHITPPPISSQAMADLLSTIVILCQGKDRNEQDFWAYMCIKPSMAESFKAAQIAGNMNLGDFGTIIEAGEGIEAPDEVKARMQRDYGVREDYEEQLIKAIEDIKRKQNG